MNLFFRLLVMLVLLSPIAEAKSARLNLADVNGKEYSLLDYRGSWVVVNYWATWCLPCLQEIPALNKLNEKGKKSNVVVLSVNFENASDNHIKTFVEKYNISYPVLLEEMDAMSQLGTVDVLPKTFIISPSGRVEYTKTGVITFEFIEEILLQLKKAQ